MMKYYSYPFLAKGLAFPFRINPNTGGTQLTEGNTDSVSVALQYIQERWTIREGIDYVANHVAEAISHILLTIPGEHDTLPEFGSRVLNIIFEPDTQEFRLTAKVYFETATDRWEKRAHIVDTQWYVEGVLVDQGRLPVFTRVDFIVKQVPGNLVKPYVSDRAARLQEYKAAIIDANGHDLYSRYYKQTALSRDNISYVRLRNRRGVFQPAQDDIFYRTVPTDTWLLISWHQYGDIRFWPIVARNFINDNTNESRGIMNILRDPESGIVLRLPSRSRLLNYLALNR